MHAMLGAADALDEPLVAVLGEPSYYARYGFRPSAKYGITASIAFRGGGAATRPRRAKSQADAAEWRTCDLTYHAWAFDAAASSIDDPSKNTSGCRSAGDDEARHQRRHRTLRCPLPVTRLRVRTEHPVPRGCLRPGAERRLRCRRVSMRTADRPRPRRECARPRPPAP
jgi:hypothetical protein